MAQKLEANYYFAHPYSSWERGLNEYTNKLIRQYIPKKEAFTDYTDEQIVNIQHKLNRRPGKKLNFEKPFKVFCNMINNKVAFNT
jgi:IS30 family transposase